MHPIESLLALAGSFLILAIGFVLIVYILKELRIWRGEIEARKWRDHLARRAASDRHPSATARRRLSIVDTADELQP